MRQYSIIFGILLLFSIIDFVLVAPIPVHEGHETYIDAPGDVITVLEKRGGDDELEKLFEKLGDSHASSSSPAPGSDHGSMSDAQASESAPPTANPNPVEPSNPLSTEPSSYTSTDYSSDDGSAGTHVSQAESYPSQWDHWLDPQEHADQEDHLHQPDSPPPSPPPPQQQQQNDFAHGDDVQQLPQNSITNGHVQPPLPQNGIANGHVLPPPPPQQQNGIANGHVQPPQPPQQNGIANGHVQPPQPQQNGFAHVDEHQPASQQQNEIAHGQMDDAASTNSHASSLSGSIPSDSEFILGAYIEWLQAEHPEFILHHPGLLPQQDEYAHGLQLDDEHQPLLQQEYDVAHGSQVGDIQPSALQQNPFAHGIQMDDVAPTTYGWPFGLPTTHALLPDSPPPEFHWSQTAAPGYTEAHVHPPPPPPPSPALPLLQGDVPHWTQVDDEQHPPPSGQNGGAHGTQMDEVVPTDPSSHTPASTMYHELPGTHAQPGSIPVNLDDPAYHELHVHQPNPLPPPQGSDVQQPPLSQVDDVAHGTQVGDVPSPQESDVAHGTQ